MAPVKKLLSICSVVLGTGMGIAVDDEVPCFLLNETGYYYPYTPDGTPPDPFSVMRIPARYNPDETYCYYCISNSFSLCRYVYAFSDEYPQGRWYSCTGELIYNEPD